MSLPIDRSRLVIEHLRSGVPSSEAADLLSAGRTQILGAVEQQLDALKQGRQDRKNHIVLMANYGDGKTHALQAIREMAERAGFLVSLMSVSRESPLVPPARLYRRLVAGTYTPGVRRPGLDALLAALRERPEEIQKLLRFAEQSLTPRLACILAALFEGSGAQETLEDDLRGFHLSQSQVRAAYRESLGQPAPRLDRFTADDYFGYLQLLDRMAHHAGLGGWVILIDEMEMIGKFGRWARAKSYLLFDRLTEGRQLPHTYTAWALASSFRGDTLGRLKEQEKLGEWLAQRGDLETAKAVERPLARLEKAAVLPPLGEDELATVVTGISCAHAAAYGWTPPQGGPDLFRIVRSGLPERDAKVRQLVRAAVQVLDHQMRYGETPTLRLSAVEQPAVDPDEDADDGEGPPLDGPVRRDWPS